MTDDLIHDQLFRQRYRFDRRGDVLRVDIWSDPGGGVLTEHFHPTLEERYEVVEGELTFHLDGSSQVLRAGERAVVAAGVRHRFENTGQGESHVRVEAEPAERLQESIEEGAALGSRGDISADGKPKSASALFAAAAIAQRYRGTVVLTTPPPFVQRLLFPLLARFARSNDRVSP
jgi:mannose-6-phosphate isomerase-like protein (cupin superfamily)